MTFDNQSTALSKIDRVNVKYHYNGETEVLLGLSDIPTMPLLTPCNRTLRAEAAARAERAASDADVGLKEAPDRPVGNRE